MRSSRRGTKATARGMAGAKGGARGVSHAGAMHGMDGKRRGRKVKAKAGDLVHLEEARGKPLGKVQS